MMPDKTTAGVSDVLSIEKRDDYLLVKAPHSVSMDNYEHIEDDIVSALTPDVERLVIDLLNTEQVYSSGIGLLLRLRKKMVDSGGAICLVNVSPRCRALLDSVHLSDIMAVYSTDVEFEISQDEVWRRKAADMKTTFVCVSRVEGGVCRVTLSGHMVSHEGPQPLNERGIVQPQVRDYVFDLTGLDIVDSQGVSGLALLLEDIRTAGGRSVCYGANPAVRDLLHYLSLNELTACYDNERQALEAIGRA